MTLHLARENPGVGATGPAELSGELVPVPGLSPGRGDEDVEATHAEVAREPRVSADILGRLFDAIARERTGCLHISAERQAGLLLLDNSRPLRRLLHNEHAHRVGSDINDTHSH